MKEEVEQGQRDREYMYEKKNKLKNEVKREMK